MARKTSILELVAQMRSDDETTRNSGRARFEKLYFERLTAWAEKRLHPALRSLINPDAVANSVCRTVMRRSSEVPGFLDYIGDKPEAALRHILVQKLSDIGIHHLERACRDAARTRHSSDLVTEKSPLGPEFEDDRQSSSPWFEVAWQDALHALKEQLEEKDRRIVDSLIEGRTLEEIGREFGFRGRAIGQRIARKILPAARRVWPEWSGREDVPAAAGTAD